MWLRSAEANPGDVSKIGALSVLRKLADHLGLTSLTDHDLRVTCGTNGLVHVALMGTGMLQSFRNGCHGNCLRIAPKVVDYELMALPIPSWGCDQAVWTVHFLKCPWVGPMATSMSHHVSQALGSNLFCRFNPTGKKVATACGGPFRSCQC